MTTPAFDEEKLFELPVGSGPSSASFATADGHVASFLSPADGGLCLAWDGRTGPPFDQPIAMRDGQQLFWSDDRRHIAVMAARGDRQFVWHDGIEDAPHDVVSRSVPPTFSPDGSKLGYAVRSGERKLLIVNGEPTVHEPVGPVAAVFSPDGRRLAYALVLMPEERHRIVLDDAVLPELVGLPNDRGVLQFSPDSRRFAYYTVDKGGDARWVIDGVAGRTIDHAVRELDLSRMRGIGVLGAPMMAAFSPDSRRFAYWADVKEKGVAIIDGDSVGPIVKAAGAPVFSPDGHHLAYGVRRFSKKDAMVRDGIIGRDWSSGGFHPVFSPDSSRLAWTIEREEGPFFRKRRTYSLVVDDVVVMERDGVDCSRWPVFSQDSRHLAWWVRREDEVTIHLDGRPVIRGTRGMSEPVISASGRLVCAMVTAGGQTVIVDGTPGPGSVAMSMQTTGHTGGGPFDPTNPQFRISPDGDRVVWAGAFADGTRPVVDAVIGPICDDVFSSDFADDGTAFWLARRGDTILRITAS